MPGAARSGDSISCGDTIDDPGRNVLINGKSAIVLGDKTTGHEWTQSVTELIEANTVNVFVNGKLACTEGNNIDPVKAGHPGVVSTYSPNVNIG